MLKKKFNRAKPKKYFKKKAKKYKTALVPSLGKRICGFPDRLRCKLRLVDLVNMGDGVGSTFSKTYCINSLFNPQLTAGNVKPLYFNELSAIYSEYIVKAVKMTVQYALASSPTGGNSVLCTLDLLGLNGTADVDPELIMMRPGSDWKICSTQYPRTKIKKYWTAKEFVGITTRDALLASSVGASPVEQQLAKVYMTSLNTTVPTANALMFIATIDFYCEFFSQLPIAKSTG